MVPGNTQSPRCLSPPLQLPVHRAIGPLRGHKESRFESGSSAWVRSLRCPYTKESCLGGGVVVCISGIASCPGIPSAKIESHDPSRDQSSLSTGEPALACLMQRAMAIVASGGRKHFLPSGVPGFEWTCVREFRPRRPKTDQSSRKQIIESRWRGVQGTCSWTRVHFAKAHSGA